MGERVVAPDDIRNKLAKLVVECAAASNVRLRGRRPPGVTARGGPVAKGWKGAERLLGVPFQLIKKATQGETINSTTVERLREAIRATENGSVSE